MDEFNTRFIELSKAIPIFYAPTTPTILVYYIEALSGKMQYQIRDKEPATLVQAQEMEIKIDLNMQSSGESNLHGYSRSSTSLKINEPKDKDPLSAMNDAYEKQMMEMKREMKKNMEEAEQKHLAQLKEIQNRTYNYGKNSNSTSSKNISYQSKLAKKSSQPWTEASSSVRGC